MSILGTSSLISVSVGLSVCLSVCPLAYLKNHMSKLHEIFCTCYLWLRLILFCDDIEIIYVLPVLWMTPCFHEANTDTSLQSLT